MNNQAQLHTGTTVSSGGAWRMPGGTVVLSAWLSAAGGTATCQVSGRVGGSPWRLLWSASLSGASDHAEYVLAEPYYELKADITAIGGGAVATVSLGV